MSGYVAIRDTSSHFGDVTWAHFKPGKWEAYKGETLVDRRTGDVYDKESHCEIRMKACCFLILGPPTNAVQSVCCMVGRSVRVLSCFYCLVDDQGCGKGMLSASKDILKCLGAPFLCVATQSMVGCTAVYPTLDHRKYAVALDRLQFDDNMTSICCLYPQENVRSDPSPQTMDL